MSIFLSTAGFPYTRPLLIVPLLPVVAFTWWVSKQYLHVSREMKRLESLKKSPVFVLFSETLQVGVLPLYAFDIIPAQH